MAYNYVIGPNGQPIILGQVPMVPLMKVPGTTSAIPQMAASVVQQQPSMTAPNKPPDYMSEEKLQEKGNSLN